MSSTIQWICHLIFLQVVTQFKAQKTVMTVDTQYTNIVYGGTGSLITLARYD